MELKTLLLSPTLFPELSHKIEMSYQIFGLPLESKSPVVVVNHALTGNSQVVGENGWWKELIGDNKTIDTRKYTVIAFNVPGNGYDGKAENLILDYENISTQSIAKFFWHGLDILGINDLHSIIGGSIGGAISWEMTLLRPEKVANLLPIATSIQASDWVIGNVFVQESILLNSSKPLEDARKHAMLLYRCPQDFTVKFNRQKTEDSTQYKVENWLDYHGQTLTKRFQKPAYLLMNHLLRTIGQNLDQSKIIEWAKHFKGNVHLVSIDTDYLFTAKEQKELFQLLSPFNTSIFYSEIQSLHGHDAFLIENEQLKNIINSNY